MEWVAGSRDCKIWRNGDEFGGRAGAGPYGKKKSEGGEGLGVGRGDCGKEVRAWAVGWRGWNLVARREELERGRWQQGLGWWGKGGADAT